MRTARALKIYLLYLAIRFADDFVLIGITEDCDGPQNSIIESLGMADHITFIR